MNAQTPRGLVVVPFAAVLLAAPAITMAKGPDDRIPLEWKRDPKAQIRRAEAPSPAPPELPAELLGGPGGSGPSPDRARSQSAPGHGTDVEALARREGEAMAREAARVSGWREYWRAGFVRGVNAALEDPRLGAWDRQEGLRYGRFDPRARALGDRLGADAAGVSAEAEAETRVREQFMDLERDPVPDRAGVMRRSPRDRVPAFQGPYALGPVLDQVFVAYPPVRAAGLSRDGRRALEDWRFDRTARGYDARWKDPALAFSRWRDRQHRGSPWSRWTPAQREEFRVAFQESFREVIDALDAREFREAWRVGFDDGWRYGASVQCEWAYRQGYAQGFDLGVAETAAIAFPYAFERAYAAAYSRSFDSWSRSAHPGIGHVRFEDESGDGILEPGERVLVEVEVVNYGGGGGVFELSATGHDLGPQAAASITFRGRTPTPEVARLALRVQERVPVRTRTPLTVAIGDARVDSTIYVSRPLEIEGRPAIDTDRLGGRVTLTVEVTNTSTRDTRAGVTAESLTVRGEPLEADLGVVPAGGRRRASVTFTGIHPLDLIGAESRWRASATRGASVDDTREIAMAPVATDLSNPDLLDFLLALASTPDVSRRDVRDARALLMDRLRADWERAVEASGNPYKRDFDSSGTETVVGELVRMTQGGRRSFTSPQVFDDLGADVTVLCDELPGPHPLLRKWMRKLAKRLN